MRCHRNFQQAGFTLVELMIVVAIISIMAVLAAPSYMAFIKHDRLVSHANQLQSVFKYSRSEAVKRNQIVKLNEGSGHWLATTDIDGTTTTLQEFTIHHASISIALPSLSVSATGELNKAYQITITDHDSSTTDMQLCILPSGQSWLSEQPQGCA